MEETRSESQAPDIEGKRLARAVRIGQLLDLYGPLLTDRQQEFIKLHYEEDLSFGEIARDFNISRQAIHDAVKHAEQSLEEYDRKLQFTPGKAKRRGAEEEAPAAAPSAKSAPAAPIDGLAPCLRVLDEIHDRLRRSGGVIYNADGITRDLGEVLEKLRALQADN